MTLVEFIDKHFDTLALFAFGMVFLLFVLIALVVTARMDKP